MCPNKDWFFTYTLVEGGVVLMGNNSPSKITSIGTVKIKMHDRIIKTLSNVKHVHDLKKNPILLGILDSNGCRIFIELSDIKVSHGALVLMRDQKTSSLYTLQGLIVTSATTISSSIMESESTRLLHMRLVHISEKGFNKYCKQEGIDVYSIIVDTSQQNDIAKRMNKTLLERAQCMFFNTGLGNEFWEEDVNLASYLINWSLHQALDGKIPDVLWSSNLTNHSNLGVFGCLTYAYVSEGKLEPRRFYRGNLVEYALSIVKSINLANLSNYSEVVQAPNFSKWLLAMEEEMECLQKNETWQLVKPPIGKKIVGYKWVFKKKKGSNSGDTKYKARLVVKGYNQVDGVDFHDVFSHVVKHTSIRALLALVALYNLELKKLDVKIAFLHGDLEEDIYTQQPEGFKTKDKEDRMYIKKILEWFALQNLKSVRTPLAAHFRLSHSESPQIEDEEKYMSKVPYSSIVSSLMYAMVCTHPDILYVVSVVSRYMGKPNKLYWRIIKWILRYLRGTSNTCLEFGRSSEGLGVCHWYNELVSAKKLLVGFANKIDEQCTSKDMVRSVH
ncbi:hypothetical protein CXB51_021957 [Gossypium anomalum]|uniref:Reverse transcriptase Ty1/copia-type domain-containing protein n=1 Tax=Gossypium anomalum TaxID=47600 RepID=A0A8J5YQI8_9ROSI|nr:hypothetical protein CXB51_021957 [Gossypium anomalum]